MKYNVSGIHHITACAGGAQQDIDFFTQIVGLRMVKQTVLMDGTIPIYHLYYANAKAEPGSVMTTFPYGQKDRPSRIGSDLAPPRIRRRKDRCRSGKSTSISTRFSTGAFRSGSVKSTSDSSIPPGWRSKSSKNRTTSREGWTTEEIGAGEAVRGFYGTVLSMREVAESERFFTEALGFRKTGHEGQLSPL